MAKGVQVVGAAHDGLHRLYTSHWVCQVSFEDPVVMASVSPKHDTHPLIVASGAFTVSILAGDQIAEGQYFSYPGHKFEHRFTDYVEVIDDRPYVPNAMAYLDCEVVDSMMMRDHELFFAEVMAVREGRLGEPPLTYSSRHGWRIASERARERGSSVRDELLGRLAAES